MSKSKTKKLNTSKEEHNSFSYLLNVKAITELEKSLEKFKERLKKSTQKWGDNGYK